MISKQPLRIAVAAWIGLLGISFWFAIVQGLGPAESAHDPASVWMYARRGLLLACALVLPKIAGTGGARSYGWKITPRWLTVAVLAGTAMGFGNPGGFDPRHAASLALACFHALATELFFRAYLITALSSWFRTFWPPVILSSCMYGIFYLTVSAVWQHPGAQKLLFAGLFTVIGLLHGFCYHKSRSVYVPWFMHFLGVLNYKTFL